MNYAAADSIKGTIAQAEILFDKMADGEIPATEQDQQDLIDFIEKLNEDLSKVLTESNSAWSSEHACIQ